MPRYGLINLEGYETIWRGSFNIRFLGGEETLGIREVLLKGGMPAYLVENQRYFGRPAVYGEPDDLERFLLFSLAVVEAPRRLGWPPDILHCHDWHTGLVPALLKDFRKDDPFYASCASIYTIHNLGYQGWFDDWFASRAGLHNYMPPAGDPLRDRSYNMTAIGIYHGDIISTVSETYAREILTPEYGIGLETLLESRKDSLFGILNGIDYEEFSPAQDPIITANYDEHTLERRVANKLVIQEKAGLPVNAAVPLLGLTARLVYQKGIDVLVSALDSFFGEVDVQFVLQGTGEPGNEELLRDLQRRYPHQAGLFLVLDFSLARQIFAGCDIYLAPSRYEPCGLSHLIAMRYGAVPLVRRTGGLAQTVSDCSLDLSSGLGFVFENYDKNDLLAVLRRAVAAFQRQEGWRELMIRVMQQDFSWQSSVSKYESLYQTARRKVMGDSAVV
jgi:starch synthase